MCNKSIASRRHANFSGRPVEESNTQLILEDANSLAYRGLRNAQGFSRTPKAAGSADLQERSK
jgi:hypothetical protein